MTLRWPLIATRCIRLTLSAFVLATGSLAMAQDSITIQHVSGTTAVPAPPEKTVVYDLAVMDTLHTLGVQPAGVPTLVTWPAVLEGYRGADTPKVGTLFEPDYEAVHALSPDLVIVAGRSAPKQADLARLAPTIDLTVDTANLVESVKGNTRTLATIYQKQDEAERRLQALDEAIDAIRNKAEHAGTGMVILTVGGKMSAYGPGSRFGIIHDVFGMQPAVQDLTIGTHGQAVSFEFIYKHDPDWLFVIDRDAAIGRDGDAARRLLDNALMHKTQAWRNDRIVYLDSANWYLLGSAGLTSLQDSIAEVAQALDRS